MTHTHRVQRENVNVFFLIEMQHIQFAFFIYIYSHISQAELIDIELWLNPLLNGSSFIVVDKTYNL